MSRAVERDQDGSKEDEDDCTVALGPYTDYTPLSELRAQSSSDSESPLQCNYGWKTHKKWRKLFRKRTFITVTITFD